jgi:hypothetical protein
MAEPIVGVAALALVLAMILLVLATHFVQSLKHLHNKISTFEAALKKTDVELSALYSLLPTAVDGESKKLTKLAKSGAIEQTHLGSPQIVLMKDGERVTAAAPQFIPPTPSIIPEQQLDDELEGVDDGRTWVNDEEVGVWLQATPAFKPKEAAAEGPPHPGDPGAVLPLKQRKTVDMVEPGSVRDLFVATAREIDPTMLCIRRCGSPPRSPRDCRRQGTEEASSPVLAPMETNCRRQGTEEVSSPVLAPMEATDVPLEEDTPSARETNLVLPLPSALVQRAHLAAAALEEARTALFLAQTEADSEAQHAESALEQAKAEAEADAAAARAAAATAEAKLKVIQGLKSTEKAWSAAGVSMHGMQEEKARQPAFDDALESTTSSTQQGLLAQSTRRIHPLPPGWVVCSDPDRKEYYYHESSGAMQWRCPDGLTIATEERAAALHTQRAANEEGAQGAAADTSIFSVV